MESSETWRTKALKSFAISKSGMQGGEAKRNLSWSILDDSHVSHFWSTSWSSIYACYMSFRSSGSHQSNASNGVRLGVEIKDLQPLESNHSKLKEEFCTAAKPSFCCEMISQPFFCTVLWNSSWSFPIFLTDALEVKHRKLKANFAVLRNQPFAAKWFRSPYCASTKSRSPYCASTKSRRPRFHLRNGP